LATIRNCFTVTTLKANAAAAAAELVAVPTAAPVVPAWLRFALTGAAFFKRDLLTDFSYRLSFLLHALNILLGVAAYYFLARFVDRSALGGAEPFVFLLAGLTVNAYMSTWMVCFTDAVRTGQATGTLKAIAGTPLSRAEFVLFSALYPSARAAVDAFVYVMGGMALGASLGHTNVAAVGLVLLLSSVSFAAIGIASAAIALVFRRGDPLLWLATSLSWMLGGVLFPIELLPAPLASAARLLPITHAVSGVRLALAGGSITDAAGPLAVFAILGLPLSLAAFDAGLHRARVAGSLGHV
jgi:ABC-2 type transport system permease protein